MPTKILRNLDRVVLPVNLESTDFFDGLHGEDVRLAAVYCNQRQRDFESLRKQMVFQPGHMPGTLQCWIYGHSILLEVIPCTLHAMPCLGEVLFKGDDDPYVFTDLRQVIAAILMKNW